MLPVASFKTSPASSTKTEHRAQVLKGMALSDASPLSEVLMRYIIILAVGTSLFVATLQPIMLVWTGSYLILNGIYCVLILRPRAAVSAMQLRLFISANVFISSLYAAMPLYLWTEQEPALRAIGMCGIVGHAVFNMSRHTERNPIAIWDSISIVACILFIGWYEMTANMSGTATRVVIGVGTFAVAVYYISGKWAVIFAREQLTRAMEQAAHDGKMKAVGQLTSGISHDFNNLLTVIGGNIELAAMTHNRTEQAELLHQAHLACQRAAQLTSQLLAFSRKAQLQAEDVDIPAFCEMLRKTFHRVLPASMRVTVEADTNATHVRCDPTLLDSALLNLAINARDATEGRGHLSLLFHRCQDASNPEMMLIEIKDDGPGIPPNLISQVTEPFFTTKQVGCGSGLGLSMVAGFAEQSGGRLALISGSDGTTVQLFLPMTIAPTQSAVAQALPHAIVAE